MLVARWAISGGAIVSLRDFTQSMKLRACPGLPYRWISSGPIFSLSNDFGSASIPLRVNTHPFSPMNVTPWRFFLVSVMMILTSLAYWNSTSYVRIVSNSPPRG